MTEESDVIDVIGRETGLSGSEFSDDRSLIDLGLTSFVVVRILVALEEHFEMEFSEEQMEEVVSTPVAQLPDLVQRAVSHKT